MTGDHRETTIQRWQNEGDKGIPDGREHQRGKTTKENEKQERFFPPWTSSTGGGLVRGDGLPRNICGVCINRKRNIVGDGRDSGKGGSPRVYDRDAKIVMARSWFI